MKGTWQTTEGGGLPVLVPAAVVAGVLLAGGSAVAAVAGFLTSLVEVAGAIVVSLIALLALVAVLAYRSGWRPSLNPVVAWNPHTAVEAQQPRQALPPPQEFHLHLHGPVTPAQIAEVAAIREAGHRDFDTYRRQP